MPPWDTPGGYDGLSQPTNAARVPQKRNPVKQIMSEVHREARAGKLDLSDHGGFIAEVERRVRAAGLPDEALRELVAPSPRRRQR
jgi:hypothetical protein